MFERFTNRARRVIVVAQEEAKNLNHDFIKPEHLLLGLVQGDGVAAKVLGELGVSYEPLRAKVDEIVKSSKTASRSAKVPFSPNAKKALELSLREALRLGHNYIGTEHLLLGALGVLDDNSEVASFLGLDVNEVRTRVITLITSDEEPESSQSPAASDAIRLAGELAGVGPVTTGHLITAMLSDTASQASTALAKLGVTIDTLQRHLAEVPLEETSDAPRPLTVEIKLGETTTAIGDPALAAALGELSPEQLHTALRDVLGLGAKPETARGRGGERPAPASEAARRTRRRSS